MRAFFDFVDRAPAWVIGAFVLGPCLLLYAALAWLEGRTRRPR